MSLRDPKEKEKRLEDNFIIVNFTNITQLVYNIEL